MPRNTQTESTNRTARKSVSPMKRPRTKMAKPVLGVLTSRDEALGGLGKTAARSANEQRIKDFVNQHISPAPVNTPQNCSFGHGVLEPEINYGFTTLTSMGAWHRRCTASDCRDHVRLLTAAFKRDFILDNVSITPFLLIRDELEPSDTTPEPSAATLRKRQARDARRTTLHQIRERVIVNDYNFPRRTDSAYSDTGSMFRSPVHRRAASERSKSNKLPRSARTAVPPLSEIALKIWVEDLEPPVTFTVKQDGSVVLADLKVRLGREGIEQGSDGIQLYSPKGRRWLDIRWETRIPIHAHTHVLLLRKESVSFMSDFDKALKQAV
ncbi:hypothetical protein NMY22_g4500 [Coprinellus aureogranulatus]|nr:hypothetical protein NMY22_g4500 [Coprinellus aureogranulatus]